MLKNNVLFIDGGGTKTKGVLIDANNLEIKNEIIIKEMSNLFVSVEQSKEPFKKLSELFSEYEIEKIYISLAGFGRDIKEHKEFLEYIKELFSNENIEIYKDIEFLTKSLCDDETSLVSIFGTGSAYSLIKNGEVKIHGGYGHIFGDEGSAYSFSKEIILKVIELIDSNKEESDLVKFVFEHFGCENINQFKSTLYKNAGKDHIASIAQKVIENESFSEVTNEIFENEILKIKNKISLIDPNNKIETIYIDGGFIKNNEKFKLLFIETFYDKKVNLINWKKINDSNPMIRTIKK